MTQRSERLRGVAINATLIAVSVLLTFVVLELAFRAVDGVPLLDNENYVARRLDLIRINTGPMVYDPVLGWRLSDNHGPASSAAFSTGEHGVRMNSDRRMPVTSNAAVLAVGDSFTAGSEVKNDESYPAYLERLLGRPVVNAATGAWGVDQMILRVEQLAPVLRPSIVVVGILDQDILRNNYRIYGGGYKPYFVVENGKLVLRGTPVPRFEGRVRELGLWKSLLGHLYLLDTLAQRFGLMSYWVDSGRQYEKVHDDGPRVSGLLMHRLAELGRQHGFKPIVVMLYGGDAVEAYKELPAWILPTIQSARDSNVPLVNMIDVLRTRKPDELRMLYVMHDSGRVFGHMSSKGNLFVAQSIAAAMRDAGWIP